MLYGPWIEETWQIYRLWILPCCNPPREYYATVSLASTYVCMYVQTRKPSCPESYIQYMHVSYYHIRGCLKETRHISLWDTLVFLPLSQDIHMPWSTVRETMWDEIIQNELKLTDDLCVWLFPDPCFMNCLYPPSPLLLETGFLSFTPQ